MYLIGTWPFSRYKAGTGTLACPITRPRNKASSIFSKASTWFSVKLCQASLLNKIELMSRAFLNISPAAIFHRPSGASLTRPRI